MLGALFINLNNVWLFTNGLVSRKQVTILRDKAGNTLKTQYVSTVLSSILLLFSYGLSLSKF